MSDTVDSTAVEVREQDPHVPTPLSTEEFTQTYRVATALAASGMFKDARQAEQAFAKILIGRDLGLSPTQAMMGIHIIEGKPELSANLQAAFVKRAPEYDYRVVQLTDVLCELVFVRATGDGETELGRSSFTIEDAKHAGLAGRGPWKSYPRNMLFARAMSNGVAWYCPDVTGGLRVYAEGEVGGHERPPQLDDESPSPPPAPVVPPDPIVNDTHIDPARVSGLYDALAARRPTTSVLNGWLNDATGTTVPASALVKGKVLHTLSCLSPVQADKLDVLIGDNA